MQHIKHEQCRPIYLDYAATTPVARPVIDAMVEYLGFEGNFGNPASQSHWYGRRAGEAIEQARTHVAQIINSDPSEVIWTSGATEAINLAIKGAAHACSGRGKHLVTSSLEHKAVLDSFGQLSREGYDVTYVAPDSNGSITPISVEAALRNDTTLVSLMHVNNEVGTVTDIAAIGEITQACGVLLHVDAAQSAARLPLDVRSLKADLVSLSGHKMYGPKGVGALYIRRSSVEIEPQIHGGDQEQGIRSGTLATHQLVGMGEAAKLVHRNLDHDTQKMIELDHLLLEKVTNIKGAVVNGNASDRVPGIVNVGFAEVKSNSLMMLLKDVAISSGSACTSSRVESSHVLRALGIPSCIAECSVRLSLGRYTTEGDIELATTRLEKSVNALRLLSV